MLGLEREAVIFLYAVLTGITAWSSYEVLVLLRKCIRHSAILIGIEDLFFWTGISFYFFQQMYYTTYGSVRIFFVLGVVFGAILAAFTGRRAKKILEKFKKKH